MFLHSSWTNPLAVSIENVAAEEGFEPSQTESESAVLPLHHSAISMWILYQTALHMSITKSRF